MASNILIFEEFAGSGKGFLARPILPNNAPAFRSKIGEIGYTVKNMNSGVLVTGPLDPAVVMMEALVPWRYETGPNTGYSFLWAVPGSLWPVPGDPYRIVIDYLVDDPGTQFDGFAFKLAWQNNCKDPLG
jgi:hypothetical protein